MKTRLCILVSLLAVVPMGAAKRVRVAAGPAIFVSGSGHGAFSARKAAAKCLCFRLVANPQAADAVLEISETRDFDLGRSPLAGRTTSDATGVLTGKDGTILWQAGAKLGADMIPRYLNRDLCRGKVRVPRAAP